MPSLRLLVEYSPASLKVEIAASREAVYGVGVEERDREEPNVVRWTFPWSQ
jgi:hypothetical protein